jgi:hypothetical protein
MKQFKFFSIALILSLFLYSVAHAQPKKAFEIVCIAYYNVENLFDTIHNKWLLNNEEFTPQGSKKWTSARYYEKLGNMAYAISQIGLDLTKDGAAIVGVSEIENRGVLEDLVQENAIKERDYQIVHYDSPDRRGVDNGLLYQPKYFKVTNSKSYRLTLPDDERFRSRDPLVVSGLLRGELIHVIVNHWPSRSGGEKRSRPRRNAAGALNRHIVDSLLMLDPNAKILVMGDLNDDPVNPSVQVHLRAKGREDQLRPGDLFNPYYKLFRDGIGSLAWRDAWNLFDQIIVSQGLLGIARSTFTLHKAFVFNKNFLVQKEGAYAGYPFRTFVGDRYIGGYSDHFPVYVYLIREVP